MDLTEFPQDKLALWLMSNAGVDEDGGKLVEWNDHAQASPVGSSVKQPNKAKQPTVAATAHGQAARFGGQAHLVLQEMQLFSAADAGLAVFVMLSPRGEKSGAATLLNFGAAGMRAPNTNLEIGLKYRKGQGIFYVSRGSRHANAEQTAKVALKTDGPPQLLSVLIAKGGGVVFRLDGKVLASAAKGAGWLASGSRPVGSAPVEIGARINGNSHLGKFSAHLTGTADAGANVDIFELAIFRESMAAAKVEKCESVILAAQQLRANPQKEKEAVQKKGVAEERLDVDPSIDQEEEDSRWSPVTCGSVVKMVHKSTGVRLHSSEIGYGSGSEQQAVTGVNNAGEVLSYWAVKKAMGEQRCKQGSIFHSGDKVRLMHLGTRKFLHSHEYQSPLSNKQEVSCGFDEGSSNTGDNWEVLVVSGDAYDGGHGGVWKRGLFVRLKHVDTGKYLFTHNKKFQNGPVDGQSEIAAVGRKEERTLWSTGEGIYFPALSK